MAALFNRTNLGRGPATISLGGVTFYTRADWVSKHAPIWNPEKTSLYGQIDKSKRDLVIKNNLMVFGLWQTLSTLFPSYILNPTIGASIYGTTDQAMVVLARNGDQITYPNTQITKLTNLYLGVDSELFAAAIEVTSIIKTGANPEDAGAYFTRATGTYAEPGFATTNFKKVRWTGAWGTITGLSAISPQKGFQISWAFDAQPVQVDGYGTVDYTVGEGGLVGTCRFIPLPTTLAQIDAAQLAAGVAHGVLLSSSSADFTLTGGSSSVVLKNAGMTESNTAFGVQPLRVGEVVLETTRGFSTGTPQAVATVS